METSNGGNSSSPSVDLNVNSSSSIQFPPFRYFHSPISSLLEYSGLLRARPDDFDFEPSVSSSTRPGIAVTNNNNSNGNGEVAIRIIGPAVEEEEGVDGDRHLHHDEDDVEALLTVGEERGLVDTAAAGTTTTGDEGLGNENSNRDNTTPHQRYDIQQVARWIEQILPFSLLLLIVFIRQHLQGFFVTIWVTAFLYKANDIVKKQTALKGERKIDVLIGYYVVFTLHVFGIYWWYRKDDLYYPLLMVPPKTIPPFWHAIFTILVNDTMVRQAAMSLKLILLMYYRNGKGHNFRRQGQMLTLVEYTLLLYRALLPTPVWYRFFLNKEYGSLFSSLTTGLYLTFKLTSIVEKVKSVFAALKALSRKEVHYGTHATLEQVNATGDLCAICQEKMHVPILLQCKHIFCEDCVSEWFERERTCPLCRALVRPADLRSFGDGSTSLLFQIF